jgi:hypothetical protein
MGIPAVVVGVAVGVLTGPPGVGVAVKRGGGAKGGRE